jgi:hypothetical protein
MGYAMGHVMGYKIYNDIYITNKLYNPWGESSFAIQKLVRYQSAFLKVYPWIQRIKSWQLGRWHDPLDGGIHHFYMISPFRLPFSSGIYCHVWFPEGIYLLCPYVPKIVF